MSSNKISRRNLLIKSSGLLALPLVGGLLFRRSAWAQAIDKTNLVKETDGNAKPVSYCDHAEASIKSKKTACPARKGKDKAGQLCNGCQFYTKAGDLEGKEVGKCVIFPGKLVHGDSWCSSWTKKA